MKEIFEIIMRLKANGVYRHFMKVTYTITMIQKNGHIFMAVERSDENVQLFHEYSR